MEKGRGSHVGQNAFEKAERESPEKVCYIICVCMCACSCVCVCVRVRVRVRVRACARACVRACVRVCVKYDDRPSWIMLNRCFGSLATLALAVRTFRP